MDNEAKLGILRVQLFTAMQQTAGADLDSFWQIIDDVQACRSVKIASSASKSHSDIDVSKVVRLALAACQARGMTQHGALSLFFQLIGVIAAEGNMTSATTPEWLTKADAAAQELWQSAPEEERQLPTWPHRVPE